MKGKLIKDNEGWWVRHDATSPDGNEHFRVDTMLHPDDVKFLEDCRSVLYYKLPDVEFEIVTEVVTSVGNSEEQDEYTNTYAKLIPPKESSYQLEYNRYMKTFVNSNLNPPTIEEFVNKVNTDSDFAKYWGPGGKEEQKELIKEIMDLDAKDGLYEDDVEKLAANLANPNADKTDNWKEGYLYAKETLYTEEQVNQKMIDFAEWCRTQYKLNGETFLIEQLFSEYKSLKQPKKD
jgi:hypothetical protein